VTDTSHRLDPRDDTFVRRLCAVQPQLGVEFGLSAFAERLGEPGAAAREELLRIHLEWRGALEKEAAEGKSRLLDARVFSASLELHRFVEEDLGGNRHDPDDVGPIAQALLLQLWGPRTTSEETSAQRLQALGKRLGHLRGYLVAARASWAAEASSGRFAPTTELAIRARDVLDGMPELLRAIVDEAHGGGAEPSAPVPATLQADIEVVVDDASAALDEHRDWLTGLSTEPHGSLGGDAVDELLRLRGLDLTASEVLELGRSVAEEMRVEASRLLRRHFRVDWHEALGMARKSAPLSLVEAIAWTRELADNARDFVVASGAVPLPEVDASRSGLRLRPMPATMAPLGQAAVYLPPAPHAVQQEGLLLLREPVGPQQEALRELSVADLEAVTATCAWPGHHLQALWQNRTTTLARRGAWMSTGTGSASQSLWGLDMVKGWSLVAGELMRELGFRPSPSVRLLTIQQTLVAALVAVVDVDLALGRVSPEQGADFLVRRAGLRRPVARAVVRTLLKAPTAGLSALVGKVRIEQLRREAHRRWRGSYSDKRFLALMLAHGPIPLAYLFERLDEEGAYVSDTVTEAIKA
jgi:hypothetical protein